MTDARVHFGLVLAALFVFTGCSGSGDGWRTRDATALTETEEQQFETATQARNTLASNLMGRLSEALNEGDPATAINVCKDVAPAIAEDVSGSLGVTIGRTSFRLRNRENAPPDWARPYVEARRAEPLLLHHAGDGRLAALFPITLQNVCLQCHGPEAQLDSGVRDALRDAYPEDKATGFEEGELRGWFHVTVPPPA